MRTLRLATSLLVASIGLVACVGHGEVEPAAADAPASSFAHPELQPRTPAPAIPSGTLRGHNLQVELSVDAPPPIADAIRTMAQEAGGEIVALGVDATTGSVTVALEPDRVERFRHALSRLPATVVHESSSTNDVTQVVAQASERLAKLDRAEAEMDRLMRVTTDRAAFEAWVVQRELNTRERDMWRNNITSYVQQVRRSQVTVTLSLQTPKGAAAGPEPTARRGDAPPPSDG
jgi:hypothetical protein